MSTNNQKNGKKSVEELLNNLCEIFPTPFRDEPRGLIENTPSSNPLKRNFVEEQTDDYEEQTDDEEEQTGRVDIPRGPIENTSSSNPPKKRKLSNSTITLGFRWGFRNVLYDICNVI